jgi:enolase-phosphatase E1
VPLPPGNKAVLVDIEGTTTPIAFVHETLFPFAQARLEQCCARAGSSPGVTRALRRLREEHAAERRDGGSELLPFGDGSAYARHLMQLDRKSTGLKALQGIIWEAGYRSGALRAPVFADVPEALERWEGAGIRLRVFSSGSVLAQKLLFAHTDHGDLTAYFEGYHDTTTGSKQEQRSYVAIADAFSLAAGEVLYLSDVVAELDAAGAAGMQTGLLDRPGNQPQPPSNHPVYRDFRTLRVDPCGLTPPG